MSQREFTLPDSLCERAEALASQDGVSLDTFVAVALAERVALLDASRFLRERAAHVTRERFEEILSKCADVEPEEYDRLSPDLAKWVDEQVKAKR
jgi:hypothetical protein